MGHAAAFSFCQDKIITTGGEGGLLATDDEELWARAWAFKDHGKSYEAVYEREHGPGFRWLHESFGTNWRMTELQATIGRLQLRKLPAWVSARQDNAATLSKALVNVAGLRIPRPPRHLEHSYYRFYVYLDTDTFKAGWDRDRVVAEVAERGVPCFSGSCSEIYREGAFSDYGPMPDLPVARELGQSSIALLVHPTLTQDHMTASADALKSVLKRAVR
jgi:dTDP-4-amino-4,6-dideoxygalactose transaminase